uniref:ABC transporter domain-containing protein n=1 Tax=Toxocara canis TaxID=6265 RepID=A0A183V9A3_TOXCA
LSNITINATVLEDPFNPVNESFVGLVWFNNKLWASLPAYTNAFYNAVLRSLLPSSIPPESVGILAYSHPMNESITDMADQSNAARMIAFRIVLLLLVLSVIIASFSMVLVEERITYSKHLQTVSGVKPWLYWTVNFVHDMTIYAVSAMLIIVIYYVMGVSSFILNAVYTGSVFFLFILFGLASLPLVYLCQIFFKIPSLAFIMIGIGLFFVGTVFTMVVMLLENLMQQDDTLVTAYEICGIVFMVLPQYNLDEISRLEETANLPLPHPLEWHLMGRHCLALFLQFLFFALLLTIIEYRHVLCKFLRNRERKKTKRLLEQQRESHVLDVDVMAEQQRVASLLDEDGSNTCSLIVDSLAKTYNSKQLAVSGISFAVEKGECFGLLGVNGAGKTTTFNMLTGRIEIGCGDAFICGTSVSQGGVNSLRQLGYCPQFDALNLKLTAREQLTFYSRLRAIPESKVDEVVEWALNEMQLRPYADEISRSYSGGNKRKLSAAIALIADPPVVLLDEPSAGMDPSSQHFMWNLILQLRRAQRTVIITSHSMEECEMLCTRIAIMVRGQLECLGPLQHLKQKSVFFFDEHSLVICLYFIACYMGFITYIVTLHR